jgi:hypothetical protein
MGLQSRKVGQPALYVDLPQAGACIKEINLAEPIDSDA